MDNSSSAAPALEFSSAEPVSSDDALALQSPPDQPSIAPRPPFELLPEYEIEAEPLRRGGVREIVRRIASIPVELVVLLSYGLALPLLAWLVRRKAPLRVDERRSKWVS